MCLILIAYESHPEYPLIVAANRDEFFSRRTKAASFWNSDSGILAGKDLERGGTWLAAEQSGSFSAVTNYRDPDAVRENVPTRGSLVVDFLRSALSVDEYLTRVAQNGVEYNGYNLLVYRNKQLGYYSNRSGAVPHLLKPGIYGLSNHLLNTPWPKVENGQNGLKELVGAEELDVDAVMHLLRDRGVAEDQYLPATGVPLDLERSLSSIFIRMNEYGTRCSTLVLFGTDGTMHFQEYTFNSKGEEIGSVVYEVSPGSKTV